MEREPAELLLHVDIDDFAIFISGDRFLTEGEAAGGQILHGLFHIVDLKRDMPKCTDGILVFKFENFTDKNVAVSVSSGTLELEAVAEQLGGFGSFFRIGMIDASMLDTIIDDDIMSPF